MERVTTSKTQTKRDKERQDRLENLDVRVLRFTDGDVRQNLEGVLQGIRNWIDENAI